MMHNNANMHNLFRQCIFFRDAPPVMKLINLTGTPAFGYIGKCVGCGLQKSCHHDPSS